MIIEELAAKHAADYPGYQLVDFYEAAFPSYAIVLQVLMQRQRPLTAVEEFVLRAVDAGQNTVEGVAGLLGLEWTVVESGLDTLQRRSYVTLLTQRMGERQDAQIGLTNKGRGALSELLLIEPQPTNFSVCLDGLTGQFYAWRPLMQSVAFRDLGLHAIPTRLPMPPIEKLDRMALKRLVREDQRDLPRKAERQELSEILAVEKSWTAYRPMRVLQYVRLEDHAVQVEVFDASERSPLHVRALLEMEAGKYRPLRGVRKEEVPPSDSSALEVLDVNALAAARRSATEAPKLEAEIEEKRDAVAQAQAQLGSRLVIERQDATYKIEQLQRDLAEREERLRQLELERDPSRCYKCTSIAPSSLKLSSQPNSGSSSSHHG